jgi:hypothetical protein
MSGFLAHLVQRTLSTDAQVRPRPVSLFEPEPAPLAVPRAMMAQDDAWLSPPLPRTAEPSLAATEAPHGREPRPTSDDEFPPREAPASDHSALAARRPLPGAPIDDEAAIPSVRRPVRDQELASEISDEGRVASPSEFARPIRQGRAIRRAGDMAEPETADTTEIPQAPMPRLEPPAPELGPVATEVPARQPLRGEPRDRRDAAAPEARPAALTRREAVEPRRTVSPEATPEQPLAAWQAVLVPRLPRHDFVMPPSRPPIGSAIGSPMQPPTTRAAEPTVHVTIGRVEIRAVQAPAAASKRSVPPKPTLSLADYLDRRNGGRR